jgi:N-acetylglucosaminyldiphosphoundecaprenol N-acetyl-beta-D-mannosaminyltransferase
MRFDVPHAAVHSRLDEVAGVGDDERVKLFGVAVDALTMAQTVDRCRALVRRGGVHQHVVLNAAKVVDMASDQRLLDIVRSCAVVNADGASIVWASRVLGRRLPERVAGIDLFVALVAAAEQDGSSVFFLGARSPVVTRVADVMRERHPRLLIAGYADGYWQNDKEIVDLVRRARPDYLFLAVPSPRKEYWLSEHLQKLDVPLVMGVGGSFDVIAGVTSRAPRWMQNVGMEWLWRLAQEPRRMWRRYLVGNAKFMRLTLAEWHAGRR